MSITRDNSGGKLAVLAAVRYLARSGYNTNTMATVSTFDQFLDPTTGCLTPQVAQRIVDWRPDPELQAHIQKLGEKANSGTLSPDEEFEYQQLIEDGDLIALLQAKARRILTHSTS